MSRLKKVVSGIIILISFLSVSVTANAQDSVVAKKKIVTINYAFTYESYNGKVVKKEELEQLADSLNIVFASSNADNFVTSEFKPSDLVDRSHSRNLSKNDFKRISFVIDEANPKVYITPSARNYYSDGKLNFDLVMNKFTEKGIEYFNFLSNSNSVMKFGKFDDKIDGYYHNFHSQIDLHNNLRDGKDTNGNFPTKAIPDNEFKSNIIKINSSNGYVREIDFSQNNEAWISFHMITHAFRSNS